MNSNSVVPNKSFEELVESYIDGSITEEHSKELLELIQSDEVKRNEFGAQLQLSQLLAIKEGRENLAVDEKIMALLRAPSSETVVKQPRRINWSRALVRVAAVLMAVVGVSYVIKLNFQDSSVVDKQYVPASREVVEKRIADKVDLSAAQRLKEESRESTSVDTIELQKDIDALISTGMDETVAVLQDKEQGSLDAPVSPAPQEFDEIITVKSPIILRNIYGSTRNVGNRASRSGSRGGNKQRAAGYDYRIEDLEFGELKAGEIKVTQKSKQDVSTPGKPESKVLYRENMMSPVQPPPGSSGESYAKIEENIFLNSSEKPLSTFSIDVDTASYSNLRRMLNSNQLPPANAVRIEEMINYFQYNYAAPGDEAPFSSAMALHPCPWNPEHQLLRVGLQGRKMDPANRKPSNLVFLLDVSGSMDTPDRLPLLKTGMTMLVNALTENDRVAIVVYAGSSGLVLDSTSAAEKGKIIEALQRLSAGGSTAGGAGIELAYRVAVDNYIKDGVNRVILATDGDFNVGTSSHEGLQTLIEQKRASGVFLSVLGFGTGNLQDSKMELLANKGNGNYFYIDTEREARKVLVEQLNATLVTIAKDVKIQIEFNPEYVKQYRLIGYENRKMAARDFADDKKDAGEIGAGHQVTALYEIIPVGAPEVHDSVPLKYGKKGEKAPEPQSNEMLTLKLRYKEPEEETSRLLSFPLSMDALQKDAGDGSFRWAAAVAAFGQLIRGSQYAGQFSLNDIRALAIDAKGEDPCGYRAEFIRLVEKAAQLKGDQPAVNDKGYPIWQYRK